jgi:pyruvate dehydrogenase E2 component (dihydrolipoamide acetyltransferase)
MAKDLDAKVPDIGDYEQVPVIEVLVKDGDRVEKDAPLIVLESDKATMEVPAPAAGVVRGLKVKAGDKVSEGDVICQLETADATATKSEATPKSPPPAAAGGGRDGGVETPSKPPPPKPSPASGGGNTTVTIPDIGDYHDVPVIEVLVKDGDRVEKDAPLVVLESDKATMEVPSPTAGTVRDLKLKVGDKVSRGAVVCQLDRVDGPAPDVTSTAPPKADAARMAVGPAVEDRATKSVAAPPMSTAPMPAPATPPAAGGGHAGPATRKFARELGVDLTRVSGTGAHGRVTVEDVQAFVKKAMSAPAAGGPGGAAIPPIPAVDFSQFGPIEKKPLSRIRKLSATHLHRAWLNVPHVTQFDEADITDVEAFRKSSAEETGKKLTLLPFIMKAAAKTMEEYPDFRASLAPDGENLILKQYCHIGFAADTEHGLVVPVVRDVDRKGVVQLADECGALAKKARDGKLKADEMKGGCFSISSLGGIGGSHFTPIVNAPEVAILGASRAQLRPVWTGKAFEARLILPLSLSYDHRVIDGAYAARFIVLLVKLLSDVRRLAL